ncbi:MAG: cellobiose phosphorylase [Lachnospiraceae bacterium]|nr:cellobiose phosphorylase [Lachnospiraceae bacterium]
MGNIGFIDGNGSFCLKNPQDYSYLYFPVAGEDGIRSCLTPLLGGDAKKDQNTFLYEPVSAENLHNNQSTRNFWCRFGEGEAWSATGVSAKACAVGRTTDAEETELLAGFMWHVLKRTAKDFPLASSVMTFVPDELPEAEVTTVTIKNTGDIPVSFTPMAVFPMYARSADNIRDHRHVTSLLHRSFVTRFGVKITPTLTFDERGHKKNEMTYYVYGADGNGNHPVGAVPCTEDVIGEGGNFLHPGAVFGKFPKLSFAGDTFSGYETCGMLVFAECTLLPGEEKSFILCAGIGADTATKRVEDALSSKKAADWRAVFERTKTTWQEQVNIHFSTGDKRFDQYMRWVAFQPILRRIYGCSFLPHHDYGRGGRGWRDLWQDCLALLLMNPDGVRKMLLGNFGGVRMDGTNATIIGSGTQSGVVQFIADRNNISRVWMDHGFWPLHTTAFYIHQTGDLCILLEEAGYFKDKQVMRGGAKDGKWDDSYGTQQKNTDGSFTSGTVLEHILVQNLTAFYDVGEHNRIRLRGADWNDALDMAGERGESAAFTFAYAGNLARLKELLAALLTQGVTQVELAEELSILLRADKELYADVQEKQALLAKYGHAVAHECSGRKTRLKVQELCDILGCMEAWWKETLREEEWLFGEYSFFNGYYDNHGRRVEKTKGFADTYKTIDGSCNALEDGRNLSDGGSANLSGIRMMLTSQVFAVESGVATPEQINQIIRSADALLYRKDAGGYCLNTDFHEVKDDLGRMFGFAYGHKENGAVFSHMAVMYGNALYRRGFPQAGYRALISLYRQAADFEKSKIYPGIPEYFNDRGRGMYHYLTGAASWYLMTVLTEMFGIRGHFGDLVFEPKLMEEQFDQNGCAKAKFVFAGRKLQVTYIRGAGTAKEMRILVEGKTLEGNCIPRAELARWDKEHLHEIFVEWV